MFRLILLKQAQADLASIQRYITVQSGSQAVGRRQAARLTQRCREMAAQEFCLGRPRDEIQPDIRSIASGNYVIFLRYRGDVLEIIRIIEGHRDVEAQFEPPPG